jgi:very-short-patch-repair endonuclease
MEIQASETLDKLGIEYIREYSIKELRGKTKPLRFDFYIPNLSAFIECDGEQHFKVTRYEANKSDALKNLKERQQRDKKKDNYCTDNALPLLRIHYKNPNIAKTIIKFINELEQLSTT